MVFGPWSSFRGHVIHFHVSSSVKFLAPGLMEPVSQLQPDAERETSGRADDDAIWTPTKTIKLSRKLSPKDWAE